MQEDWTRVRSSSKHSILIQVRVVGEYGLQNKTDLGPQSSLNLCTKDTLGIYPLHNLSNILFHFILMGFPSSSVLLRSINDLEQQKSSIYVI